MDRDFEWDAPLEHRHGADANLLGIDLFVEFDWIATVGHPQNQFPNGLCLARRIRKECPKNRRPCLLLMARDEVKERSFSSDSFYAVVINLPRYLKVARADASAAYFGDAVGAGLTRINAVEALVGVSPEEIDAFRDLKITPERVAEWASGNAQRLSALRRIVGPQDAETAPPSVERILEGLSALEDLSAQESERIAGLLAAPDGRRLVELLTDRDLLPVDLLRGVDHHRRCKAVEELDQMLAEDLTEAPWQEWFQQNDWVLGSDYVRILDERSIDVAHIADYLMEAYDGFLDLIEIKRPEGNLSFWASARDHGNLIPHTDLIKAIAQASRYLFEIERESDSLKFFERIGAVRAIKPRCVLIFGRSTGWRDDEREAYRLLNASYHNLSILTFDHVLARARRILGLDRDESAGDPEIVSA